MRPIDYSFPPAAPDQEQSILAVADDLTSFLANFPGLTSLSLMTLNDPKYVKSRFLLDHLKLKCASLVGSAPSDSGGTKMRVLMLERETDLSTPALLDLHYESLLSDILAVDFAKPVEGDKARVEYNESSKLYEKYRYTFLNHVMDRMPNELKDFKTKYKGLIDRDSDLSSGNVNKAIMSVGQHNQELSAIRLHLQHTKSLDEWLNGEAILGGVYQSTRNNSCEWPPESTNTVETCRVETDSSPFRPFCHRQWTRNGD